MASHAPTWAGVGSANAPANQSRVAGENRSRTSATGRLWPPPPTTASVQAAHPQSGLRPVAHLHLRQHPGDVVLHRLQADPELSGDLGVAPAIGDEREAAVLALGQALPVPRPASAGEDAFGDT